MKGLKGSKVQEFKGSMVQRFKGSKVQGFKGSKVQGFKGSRVQGFKGSKVQEFKSSMFAQRGAEFKRDWKIFSVFLRVLSASVVKKSFRVSEFKGSIILSR